MFNSNRKKELINARVLAASSIVVLVATRLARRWNQTGQKFAGEPDIARTFFSEHRLVLWSLVGFTYLWNLQCLAARAFPRFPQIAAGAIATTLATASLTFKLAFTHEDSPELMVGIAKSMADSEVGVSLVARARIAFIAIGLALVYTLIQGFSPSKKHNSKNTILCLSSHFTHPFQQLCGPYMIYSHSFSLLKQEQQIFPYFSFSRFNSTSSTAWISTSLKQPQPLSFSNTCPSLPSEAPTPFPPSTSRVLTTASAAIIFLQSAY